MIVVDLRPLRFTITHTYDCNQKQWVYAKNTSMYPYIQSFHHRQCVNHGQLKSGSNSGFSFQIVCLSNTYQTRDFFIEG